MGVTYTWEFDTAVTAFWCSSSLLDVKVSELATWGLDNSDLVGTSVVSDGNVSMVHRLVEVRRIRTGFFGAVRNFCQLGILQESEL